MSSPSSSRRAARAALAVPALALLACAATEPAPPAAHQDWLQETALASEGRWNACAVADLDPTRPGNEIAVVGGDGRVVLLARVAGAWQASELGRLAGEPIQCAAGDLVDEWPGDELVTVGMQRGSEGDPGPGCAVLWRRDAQGWSPDEVLVDDALLHAVAIGELDPAARGAELVVSGFAGVVHVGRSLGGGELAFEQRSLVPDGESGASGHAKGAAIGAGRAALALDDGSLLALRPGEAASATAGDPRPAAWRLARLASLPAPLARVAVDAEGVLVCANDGLLRYVQSRLEGALSATTTLLAAPDRLRGAVIADVDPGSPGPELATAGYDGLVRVLRVRERSRDERGLVQLDTQVLEVARDDDKLHHLAAGELGELGPCLVAVGYSGRVLVVHHRARAAPGEESPARAGGR